MQTLAAHPGHDGRITWTTIAAVIGLSLVNACSGTSSARQPAPAGAPAATVSNQTAPVSGKSFCATLQPLVQPFVKPALTLFRAADATTDDLHAGEAHYVDCDFRPPGGQVDVSLHDDADHRFDDASENGYAALPGFGDRARYFARGIEMRWVDVVRGSIACEARLTLSDSDINGDWNQAAGKACDAAFSVREVSGG